LSNKNRLDLKERDVVAIIDQGTTSLLGLALDAAVMRQQALAQNIANVNTPGYRRLSVNFEARMAAAADAASGGPRAVDPATLRPFVEVAGTGAADTGVELDTEVAAMAENTLRHQVLLKALGKHLGLIALAVTEGKR
jgi:flagellar basal-body rod protein FlgB